MADKIDIYHEAKRLLSEHGEDAPIVAAIEADSCLGSGDLDGKIAWLKVLETIKQLQTGSASGKRPTIH